MITSSQLHSLQDFINNDFISDEWFLRHTSIKFHKQTHTVAIIVDNINEQECDWMEDKVK